jgi:hypothetical protein
VHTPEAEKLVWSDYKFAKPLYYRDFQTEISTKRMQFFLCAVKFRRGPPALKSLT